MHSSLREDAVQEFVVAAHLAKSKIDPSRPRYEILRYLVTSGKNGMLGWLIKQYKYNNKYEYSSEEPPMAFDKQTLIDYCDYAVDELDEQILTLYLENNTTRADISDVLNKHWSVIDYRLERILRKVREDE